MSNPKLKQDERQALVAKLMNPRRTVKAAKHDEAAKAAARGQVDAAKTALGERGPVWWTDGAPDYNRKLAKNTPFRERFEALMVTR